MHHSSDLFHAQQEITRATAASMRAKIKQAKKNHHECMKQRESLTGTWEKSLQEYAQHPSATELDLARLETLKENRERMQDARKDLGEVYHPYDLSTGQPQTREQIEEKMEHNLASIELLAMDADL